MATLVHTGTQAQVAGASSITINSPSATAGNKLVLCLAWFDNTGGVGAETLTVPSGWTADHNPPGVLATSLGGNPNFSAGFVVYSKTAAGGVESPVVNGPHAGQLYANGIITEWSGMGAHDTADASALVNNTSAPSTTGATVPNTGTLANANSTVFTGVMVLAGTGLNPAGIAFSGGGWTTEVSDQDSGATIGTVIGHKTVTATTALGAVYTWTSDSTMSAIQAAVVVYSDSSGSGSGATTEAPDLSAGSGSQSISGSGATAEAHDTVSGAGAVGTGGVAAITEGGDSVSGAGGMTAPAPAYAQLRKTGPGISPDYVQLFNAKRFGFTAVIATLTGSGAPTQGSDTVAGSGAQSIAGSGVTSEAADTFAGSGSSGASGSGAMADGSDTATGTGSQSIGGSGASAENADVASGVGSSGTSGAASISEGADTAAGAGSQSLAGAGATTEDHDTFAGTGSSAAGSVGSGATNESGDVSTGAGAQSLSGSGASTESSDTYSGTGAQSTSGAGASAEAHDTVTGVGSPVLAGTGAVNDAPDVAAGAGTQGAVGANAASESSDTVVGTGSQTITGSGAALEDGDTSAAAGFQVGGESPLRIYLDSNTVTLDSLVVHLDGLGANVATLFTDPQYVVIRSARRTFTVARQAVSDANYGIHNIFSPQTTVLLDSTTVKLDNVEIKLDGISGNVTAIYGDPLYVVIRAARRTFTVTRRAA